MANRRFKTIAPNIIGILLLCLLLLVAVPAALAAPGHAATPTPAANDNATSTFTPTPDATVIATPTAVASSTPVPAPSPRKVFITAKWINDHVSMQVTNNGGAITVEGYIEDTSNKNIVPVSSGESKWVNTNTITAETGQIIIFGFKAYENGTQIDTFESSVVAGGTLVSPTPPPETASLSGTVTDSASSAPIEGAEVVLKSQSFGKSYTGTTDSSGTYNLGNIYPDTYDIIINKNGYKQEVRHTTTKIEGMQTLDPISIQKSTAPATPTPVPTPTPTPTPANPLDAWIALISSPTACIATAGGGVGLILSLTALYEWMQRQKERRLRDSQQHPPAEQPPKK